MRLGSSPLARGLLPPRPSDIPRFRDHPRSRGVYPPLLPRCTFPLGSSPLARGLPLVPMTRTSARGIIPARAGFTRVRPGRPEGRRDHPRSRGVYRKVLDLPDDVLGSSPLARGLRVRVSAGRPSRGIIPARAGFTGGPGRPRSCPRDHPRSRGVYRGKGLLENRGLRIIPARAGFTHRHDPGAAQPQDHPRSRGVYCVHCAPIVRGWGSSPLARGLPTCIRTLSAE